MFTGIIEATGTLTQLQLKGGDLIVRVTTTSLDMSDVNLGDSIATNGVCLTVTEKFHDGFKADVSNETLSLTRFAEYKQGQKVNLEKALQPISRLGGHLVSGHVDGLGSIVDMKQDARSVRIDIQAPDELAKYIAHKGSITVDGISLTVNSVAGAVFSLNIIPHTQEITTIGQWQIGTQVNLEVDIIARYLERLLLGEKAAEPSSQGISMAFLAENGFLK